MTAEVAFALVLLLVVEQPLALVAQFLPWVETAADVVPIQVVPVLYVADSAMVWDPH